MEEDQIIVVGFGSAEENVPGLAHIYEHVLVKRAEFALAFTSYDYILMIPSNSMQLRTIDKMLLTPISSREINSAIRDVDNELSDRIQSGPNNLWRTVWGRIDKRYTRSPIEGYSRREQSRAETIAQLNEAIKTAPLLVYKPSSDTYIKRASKSASFNKSKGSFYCEEDSHKYRVHFTNFAKLDLIRSYYFYKSKLAKMKRRAALIDSHLYTILIVENEIGTKAEEPGSFKEQDIKRLLYEDYRSYIDRALIGYYHNLSFDEFESKILNWDKRPLALD